MSPLLEGILTGDTIRLGFLGGGMMCQVGHLPFYHRDPRCEVACIAEPRPSLRVALSEQFGADRVISDYREMLGDESIDAIVISAPRPATGPLTFETLTAGKHALAEKPMAHTAEQARNLTDAAAARGLLYAIGFMKRYDPGVRAAKSLFDDVRGDNSLGDLLLARFYDYSSAYAHPVPAHARPDESRAERFETWPLAPEWLAPDLHEGYAWFLNAASHDVNLLRYFLPGEVRVVSAAARGGGTSVLASLDSDGVPVSLDVAKTAAGRWVEGAEFLFEEGIVTLEIPSPMAATQVARVKLFRNGKGGVCDEIKCGRGWCFELQARGFIDALGGEAGLLTDGPEGVGDMELIEAIWHGIQEGS